VSYEALTPIEVWRQLMEGIDAWSKGDTAGVVAAWDPLAGSESGTYAVIVSWMLDLAGLALRLQVSRPSPMFFELPAILARLSADGTVDPQTDLEGLGAVFTYAAALAGGIRPPIQPLLDAYWNANLFQFAGLAVTFALTSLVDLTGRSTTRAVRDLTAAARANRMVPPTDARWSTR
jgi:hypothetical protein